MILALQTTNPFDAVPRATGARVNEALAVHAVVVDPAAGRFRTLAAGFREAHRLLVLGRPVKLSIRPGTYREEVSNLDWTRGKAADTVFVIEGKDVVWTGSDPFPTSGWTRVGRLLRRPWTAGWGNFSYSWGVKKIIGHRSEMAFVGDQALMPRVLETYRVDGVEQDPAKSGQVTYRYLGVRDPQKVLQPGQFGVTERAENGRFVYVRLPAGPEPASVELSVRRRALDLSGKNNVVVRGITFQRFANDDREYGTRNALRFAQPDDRASHDVLIERCRFLWNALGGLYVKGQNWTLRDVEASYNGGSGFASGKSRNVLFERTRTNFNVWRLWRAGEIGYYTGGFKMHETRLHTIEGHEAIGNATMGLWWDVHCHDVRVRDVVSVENTVNLQFELGRGPFVADRMLLVGGRADDGLVHLWEHGSSRIRNSVFTTNYHGNGFTCLYNLRWFGRDDPHGAMETFPVLPNEATGNLFVGRENVKNFGMVDDIRLPDKLPVGAPVYRGRDNVFWHPTIPDLERRWIKDDGRTGDLAARALDPAAWMRSANYSEIGARRADPMFRDPMRYDFRIGTASPLYRERSRWPQVALTSAQRTEMARFFRWSGFTPGVWGSLPEE